MAQVLTVREVYMELWTGKVEKVTIVEAPPNQEISSLVKKLAILPS
jgi:hypothetical protein